MSDGTDVQEENKLLNRTTFKLQIKITHVECKFYTIQQNVHKAKLASN